VILTFGLLSPDKGIEYVIESMPRVLERHPNAVYVVLGETHPHVKKHSGDSYRAGLAKLADRLGVAASIIFHDRFVDLPELVDFLSVADIYVTPYLNLEQITSGTLAYAMGAGRAVVSTPYRYARELLAEQRGVLVPIRNPTAMADAFNGLFSHPEHLSALGARAGSFARDMLWPSVARRHVESMDRAKTEHARVQRNVNAARTVAAQSTALPPLNLDHLRSMTDATGLLQHAAFSVPRYEDGYCLDDNARALLLMTLLDAAGEHDARVTRPLAARYLAFVRHAFNADLGRFRNFMTFSRIWTEPCGSEDSHGRALWALGARVGQADQPGSESLERELFLAALPAAHRFESPRGCAFSLLGIDAYQRVFNGDRKIAALQRLLARRLVAAYAHHSGQDWRWYEDRVSYDNARLPQALIVSGSRMGDEQTIATGIESLQWLASIQRSEDGHFSPIGSDGFYPRGGDKALFDQQPIEACAMVSACLDALRITKDERWGQEMRRVFGWFRGDNVGRASLYDPTTGGCRDGLHADRVNLNQGAESTLSFLLARTDMARLASVRGVNTRALGAESMERDRAAE
jgi:hypothetical protein